jgi:hypothetical protein
VISLAGLPLPPQKAQLDWLEHSTDESQTTGVDIDEDQPPGQ